MWFYGLDPERVTALPQWMMKALLENMPRLEAEALERLSVAAITPFLSESARGRYLSRLSSLARPFTPEHAPMEVIEYDPQKAAEWFRAQGGLIEEPPQLPANLPPH